MSDIRNPNNELHERLDVPLYPENCIRGIADNSLIGDDGTVGAGLFQFVSACRSDGWIEESINWDDDEQTIPFTLSQVKEDGVIQFRTGYAIIPRADLDYYCNLPAISGKLGYERARIDGNPYHGNILLLGNVGKITRKKINGGLASLAITKPR